MKQVWRPLLLAAALSVSAGVGVATAQIVMVKNAPPGSAIELVLNSATIGTATADAAGNAVVTAKLPAGTNETDVHIYVDLCDKSRRIVFIERGLQPQEAGTSCDRREIVGWFLLRAGTSMLIDTGTSPSVWLRQGPIPNAWLTLAPGAVLPGRGVPKGLVLFGGGGFEKFRDFAARACGDTDCTPSDFRPSYTVGADFWVTRFLAAEVAYLKPGNAKATGSGTSFSFDSSLKTQVLTVAAKVGVPVGPVRVYGRVGTNYQRSTFTTTDTITPTTVTVNDQEQTIPGGTQTFELQTRGWSWMFAGGLEGWVSPSIAIFGEAGLLNLKGKVVPSGEGTLDDRLTSLLFGVRVHIGG